MASVSALSPGGPVVLQVLMWSPSIRPPKAVTTVTHKYKPKSSVRYFCVVYVIYLDGIS
jgi:hypothetical protein